MDQRGYLRAGISDIGAFKAGAAPLKITSIDQMADGVVILQAVGVPGAVHTIERSVDPAAPGLAFGPVAPTMAVGSGRIEFMDGTPAGFENASHRLTFP
jgi:hypothetical protein